MASNSLPAASILNNSAHSGPWRSIPFPLAGNAHRSRPKWPSNKHLVHILTASTEEFDGSFFNIAFNRKAPQS